MAKTMTDKKKNTSRSQVAELATPEKDQPSKATKTSTSEDRHAAKASNKGSTKRETAKKLSLLARLRNNKVGGFFYDAYYELRYKVTWPTFIEARNMTAMVIIACAILGAVLAAWDFGLLQLFRLITGTH